MRRRPEHEKLTDNLAALLSAVLLSASILPAQPRAIPRWQIDAGGRQAFDVASVKPATGEFRPPTFPLDESDRFSPTGGHFYAQGTLMVFIQFAWKFRPNGGDQAQAMLAALPKWAAMDRFEIEARVEGNPTKDQMRLMTQSLLAERFHLAVHTEMRDTAVFAFILVKPGKPGAKLRPHAEGPPCDMPVNPAVVFPAACGVAGLMMRPGPVLVVGSRNASPDLMASVLAGMGSGGRPGVDRTGLTGTWDFMLEYVNPVTVKSVQANSPNPDAVPAPQGPLFEEALHDQLGIKLESTRALVRFLVIDHIERPSEN